MGPSGSGKTTLLDLLAGRKTQGKTVGTVLFGGKEPSKAFLRRYTGYVEQFDTLISMLTVEEMLMYTAELKRSASESMDSKKRAVQKVLEKLSLEPCRSVKIGSKMEKGISGGQAKRTNIGLALIANPRVLFLDEPTSGLDSFTANEVMTVVKQLVQDGTTICATIHSPSQFTFSLFDRLLMLNNAAKVLEYLSNTDVGEEVGKELHTQSATMIPWYRQVWILFKYRTRRNYTDPGFLSIRLGDKIMTSLIIMTLFWNVGKNFDEDNLVNINGLIFIWNTLPGFSAFGYAPAIFMERGLYARERADGLYYPISYLLAKMVDEMLLLAIVCLAISAYVFFGVKFQGDFSLFYVVFWLENCVGVVIAYVVALISPSMEAANALLPTYVISVFFLQGFLIRDADQPPWWNWYSYISFLKYSYGSYIVNQYSGDMGDPTWMRGYYIWGQGRSNLDARSDLDARRFFLYIRLGCEAWLTLQFKNFRSR
eukprot:gene8104-1350_t